MFELLQFSIVDMTPYSRPIYFNTIDLYNQSVWPVHIVALLMSLWLLLLFFRPGQHKTRVVLMLLGIAWVWDGWIFHMQYYSSINWAGVMFGYLFLIQGGLLLAVAWLTKASIGYVSSKWSVWPARALLIFAILIYPLTGFWEGRSLTQLEMFAMTPTPTLIVTFAFLLLMKGRVKYGLVVIPLLWSLIAMSFAWRLQLLEVYIIAGVFIIWLINLGSEIIKFKILKFNYNDHKPSQ